MYPISNVCTRKSFFFKISGIDFVLGKFNEAEAEFIKAGKPKEAVLM